MLHTSAALQPSEPRRDTTARWLGESPSTAAWIMRPVSSDRTRASGASAQSAGNDAQWPGHRGASDDRKRSGATAGTNESSTDRSHSADNGIARLSRAAVVLAV